MAVRQNALAGDPMTPRNSFEGSIVKLIATGIGLLLFVFIGFQTISILKVEGNEAVVRQHLTKGVVEEVWRDGTHFFCGWFWDTYKYNVGTQKVTFDTKAPDAHTGFPGNPEAEYERIVIDVGENGGQKVYIAMSVNYRIGHDTDTVGTPVFSPSKLVKLHKDGIGQNYESVLLKRTIVDVVNQLARPRQALEIYSGEGYVRFANALDEALKAHPAFQERGIYVENTILYKVYLDTAYEQEIAAKQLAIQQTLRKQEETKAAEQEARRAFAESQAQVERRRQEAESKKIEQVKAAEARKEQEVLAAEAEKQKRILEAEGDRDANLARASGVLAVGTAEAQVDALKREALYGGPSGAWRARVQIADLQAKKLHGLLIGVNVVPEKTVQLLWDQSQPPGITIAPEQ